MSNPPSDTFFTQSPHWHWMIIFYFFLGGIAGGLSFLSALLDLFGRPEDRRTARIGHLIAPWLMAVCTVLLIADLDRPSRFLNMIFEANNPPTPMFKYWSPMSFGAWGVGAFSVLSGLVFLGVIAEMGLLPKVFRNLHEGPLGMVLTALSGLAGIFVAGYTGVLVAVTNRPLWADTKLLGILFLFSGVSAAAAVLLLAGLRTSAPGTRHWLSWMDLWVSLLELLIIVIIAVSIWSVTKSVFDGGWGWLFLIGTVLLGILVPVALHMRPRLLGPVTVPSAAVLVIAGSFILRTVVVLASEAK